MGFGFDGGLTVFYPQKVKKIKNRQGRVRLTGALIDDVWHLPKNRQIDMYPRNHTLTLTFSLLDYRDAAGVIYEYRIKDGSWHTNVTGDNTIRFNSLGTGTYPIEVRAVYGGSTLPGVCQINVWYMRPGMPARWHIACISCFFACWLIIFGISTGTASSTSLTRQRCGSSSTPCMMCAHR